MQKKTNNLMQSSLEELFEAILLIKNKEEMNRFFKDLCTPQELKALAERWRVCKLLNEARHSYREIHDLTGASLVTIGRVSRFLKEEPHRGYELILKRMKLVPAL